MTIDRAELRKRAEEASPGEWSVWTETTPTKDLAIDELAYQVMSTPDADFAEAVYLINADGKCPALTGCGPTSAANAAYIVAAQPSTVLALLDRIEELKAAVAPFARLGDEAAWMEKPDDKLAWGFDGVNLSWGDFRRARKALLGEKQ